MVWIYKNKLFESQPFDWDSESLKESGCVQNPDDPELFLVYNKRWDKCFWTPGPQISGNGNQYKLYLIDPYDESKHYYCEAKTCEIVKLISIHNEDKAFEIIVYLLKHIKIYDKVKAYVLRDAYLHKSGVYDLAGCSDSYHQDYFKKYVYSWLYNETKLRLYRSSYAIFRFLYFAFDLTDTNEGRRYWRRKIKEWQNLVNDLG